MKSLQHIIIAWALNLSSEDRPFFFFLTVKVPANFYPVRRHGKGDGGVQTGENGRV